MQWEVIRDGDPELWRRGWLTCQNPDTCLSCLIGNRRCFVEVTRIELTRSASEGIVRNFSLALRVPISRVSRLSGVVRTFSLASSQHDSSFLVLWPFTPSAPTSRAK